MGDKLYKKKLKNKTFLKSAQFPNSLSAADVKMKIPVLVLSLSQTNWAQSILSLMIPAEEW